ncbi:hypothetical protein A2738_02800 [Candidatus Nomurabacteria bacterium RIFCSPHIGHO2_01_FULL_42_15]|uniref:Uncharacterized protein n=1 Tax=Candidatus Nomurabacteria bacterium RIFCSPHIGHO2_01_FULL_42_15 TaxID=1801742 RepID=A0A1F6VET2_9BACT|nr:MAG: hypothetical protein A2738_02800 [Candidatus Nomurabacteria bacterium RIFCSPHIGHO2_01_FULL_42_15]OGI92797.1 MAG: hypothetical protein A3A99_02865 [Candidatus Nomurabacteria bacterium RIFCSPLOWO2_01_FULL_41_18]
MKFRLLSLYLIATLLLFGSLALRANAAPSTDILVDITPPNPAPYENTTITLKSYVYNLDSVMISWSLNSKTAASGVGKKSFSATAPAAGGETSIVATISLPDGTIESKITLKPSVMVLLWQANDSYVPPFYRGKALPTADSEVKVVAMPEVRTGSGLVSPKNMTYYWKKDYTNNTEGSGYGKNFFLFVNDYLENSNNISVTASTIDQQSSTAANINIGITEPKILFYRSDQSFGTIWQNSLGNPHKIEGNEMVEAVPYFISPKLINHPYLVWSWFINDTRVSLAGYKKNIMPLQVEKGMHGTSKLRLEIENTDKIFQATTKEINIEF